MTTAMIRGHIDNTVSYYQHQATNPRSENPNSQIRRIKSLACRFRNTDRFKPAMGLRAEGAILYS